MSEYSEFFKFAAKAGSLEGYLFKRDKVDPLTNWVGNIVTMFESLPDTIKNDIKDDLQSVLQRALEYGDRSLEAELKEKLQKLLKAVQSGA